MSKGAITIPLWLIGIATVGGLVALGLTGKLDDLIRGVVYMATSLWSILMYAYNNLKIFFAIMGLVVNPDYPGTWTKIFLGLFILGPMLLTLLWIIMNFIRGRGRS